MQSNRNRIVIASAGSGKTTFLVDEALTKPDKKIAILTYTNNNINEIEEEVLRKTWRNSQRRRCYDMVFLSAPRVRQAVSNFSVSIAKSEKYFLY